MWWLMTCVLDLDFPLFCIVVRQVCMALGVPQTLGISVGAKRCIIDIHGVSKAT